MHVAALVERNLLALEVSHRAHWRILRHQNGLGTRCGRVVADIDELGARSLGKDRGRFAHVTHIDGADVQALQQLRAGGKLHPLHAKAQRRQALFQRTLGLLQHKQAGGFLIADAQLLVLGLCLHLPGTCHRTQCDQGCQQRTAATEQGCVEPTGHDE
ncbi:hypothetical protein SDC9_100861 [bioreactor metagenome]|uniref:Uncharacterized protein n=1 Tax=bioreactor metagenome TaxID=1076179 RepID=A0A645AMW3_9ZZZZ